MSNKTPTKNDLAMVEIYARNERFALIVGLLRHVLSLCAIVICVYLIFQGIRPIIERDATAIRAFAQVIRALRLDTVISALAAGFFGVAWRLERQGKKRALAKKSEFQKKLEANDAYRSSSNNPI